MTPAVHPQEHADHAMLLGARPCRAEKPGQVVRAGGLPFPCKGERQLAVLAKPHPTQTETEAKGCLQPKQTKDNSQQRISWFP